MTVNYILKEKSPNGIKSLFLISLYLIIYIILFEFILPVNFFLPRPSILIESIVSLQVHYHLLLNLLLTASLVYLAIIAGYYLLSWSAGFLIKLNIKNEPFIHSLRIFKFFSITGLAVILSLWITNAIYGELIFAIILSYLYLILTLKESIPAAKREFIDAAIPLGKKEHLIFREVIWKSLEPSLLKKLHELGFILWTLLVVFEYIKGAFGLGYIYKKSFEYQDLSGLVALSIVTGVGIFLGTLLSKYVQKKIIRWEP